MKDIILTGPKHSGKTSAGRAAASMRLLEFIDLDELIFQRTGKSPRELYCVSKKIFQKAEAGAMTEVFSESGRSTMPQHCTVLRSCKHAALAAQRTDHFPQRIIAAGGGIIDNPEAAAVLKNSNSIIVYLSISADCAWKRIISSGGQNQPLTNEILRSKLPPFLRTENPQETHRAMHERRAAAYQKLADIVIEAEGKKAEEIASEIFEQIGMDEDERG